MRLQQAGGAIKYFIVTGVSYSSPSTILTLYGGTDYDLANSAIIEPYFSMAKAPYGFPLDEAKLRVESLVTSDSTQASPVAGTWYNKGGSLAVPIGCWRVEYAAELEVTRAAAGALDVFATLSTAANSEVNKETTTKIGISSGTSMRGSVSHCGYSGSGGHGDILSELQDGSGVHDGDRIQGKRAEDKGEGGVRVFIGPGPHFSKVAVKADLLTWAYVGQLDITTWAVAEHNSPWD